MRIYCDSHVHCYDFSTFDRLLDSAYQNLFTQSELDQQNDPSARTTKFLLFFTDGRIDKTWSKIQDRLKQAESLNQWSLNYDQASGLVTATHGQRHLLLAPARQIISAEKLEFLLLGCDSEISDGTPASQLISDHQQFAVICPWGVGKWLGARGKLVSKLVSQFKEKIFLGDNGSRPAIWFFVPQFKQSSNSIINGSDPLPIKGEVSRIGRFGVRFDIQNDKVYLASLIENIKSPQVTKHNFGQLMGLIPFILTRWHLARS